MKKRNMKAGDALVGMKRRGSQLKESQLGTRLEETSEVTFGGRTFWR